MKEYRFDFEVNQKIVDGILQGYKNYIQERIEKDSQMRISTAYAWVKGNHIDDQTALECEDIGIAFNKAKAGYTWGYLQFLAHSEKSIFIIKNSKYFNEDNFPGGKEVTGKKKRNNNEENYLKKLARINKEVEFPSQLSILSELTAHNNNMTIFDDATMKSLEESDIKNLQSAFEKFYIITYETDQANMISSIKVWMPNPSDNIAYLVDDLTELINRSKVDISNLDTSILENDHIDFDYDSPSAIDYEIYHQDDLDSQDKGNN